MTLISLPFAEIKLTTETPRRTDFDDLIRALVALRETYPYVEAPYWGA